MVGVKNKPTDVKTEQWVVLMRATKNMLAYGPYKRATALRLVMLLREKYPGREIRSTPLRHPKEIK